MNENGMTHRFANATRFLARAAIALCLNLWGCGESSESGWWPTVPEIGPTSVTIHLGDVPLAKTLHDMSHSATVSWPRPRRREWYRSLFFDKVVVMVDDEVLLHTDDAHVRIHTPAGVEPDHPCNIIEASYVEPTPEVAWSAGEAWEYYSQTRDALERLGARMLIPKHYAGDAGKDYAIEKLRLERRARTDVEFWRECLATQDVYEVQYQTASGVAVALKFSCKPDQTVDVPRTGVRFIRASLAYPLGNARCFAPSAGAGPSEWDRGASVGFRDKRIATDSEIKASLDTAGPR